MGDLGLKNSLECLSDLWLRRPPVHNEYYGVVLLDLGRVLICLDRVSEKITWVVPGALLDRVAGIEGRLLVDQGLRAEEVDVSPYLLGFNPCAVQDCLLGLQCLRFLGHVSRHEILGDEISI